MMISAACSGEGIEVVAFYNENDPKNAAMLRKLIVDGAIAPGIVDERSIEDVRPAELFRYTQCHFFAGIGGWSVALRLAEWSDDRPVWTGSCPCQPFSAAGKGDGAADERHLWPAFEWLIGQCRPATVFGEQVERAIAHGWWDDVATDLEGNAYTCAAEVLPACSVGLPHRRDRLWFMADANRGRWRSDATGGYKFYGNNQNGPMAHSAINDDSGGTGSLPGAHEQQATGRPEGRITESCGAGTLGHTEFAGLEGLAGNVESSGGGGDPVWINCHVKSLWLTPSANEDAAGTVTGKMQKMLTHQAKEAVSTGLNVQTENPGQLNVEFVCWLMGYTPEHLSSMLSAMQSYRKSPQSSSSQQKRQ